MEQVLEKPKQKVSDLPSGKLVEFYIELRDRRAKRKAAYENDDEADKLKQEKIEGMLLQRFREEGIESIKSAAGTAYTLTRTSATVADGEAFFNYCRENDAWDLVDKRANKTAVVAFRNEYNDLPPGINYSETLTIGVRRS